MTTRPLPNILSDLRLTLEGRELKLHYVPWDEGMWSIGLEAPEDSWGLFVDLEQERGRRHDSQTVEQHHGGQTYEHVRHLHDAQGTPQPFTEWLRERAIKHVHHLFKDTWTRPTIAWRNNPTHPRPSASSRCVATSALPLLPPVEWLNAVPVRRAHALIRAHDRGQMSQAEPRPFVASWMRTSLSSAPPRQDHPTCLCLVAGGHPLASL